MVEASFSYRRLSGHRRGVTVKQSEFRHFVFAVLRVPEIGVADGSGRFVTQIFGHPFLAADDACCIAHASVFQTAAFVARIRIRGVFDDDSIVDWADFDDASAAPIPNLSRKFELRDVAGVCYRHLKFVTLALKERHIRNLLGCLPVFRVHRNLHDGFLRRQDDVVGFVDRDFMGDDFCRSCSGQADAL